MMGRRLAAIVALVLGPASLILAVILMVQEFPQGLGVLALVGAAAVVGWYGLIRRGLVRVVGLSLAVIGLVAAILIVVDERALEIALIVGGLLVTSACAEAAVSKRAKLSPASAPKHPVLIFNPKSGGGKAERFSLATEAQARGIEARELQPGRGPRGDRPGRRGGRRRRACDGRRRRLAGDRRRGCRRARPPVRLHPGGDPQPLRPRPRGRPRRRRRRARRLRRRRPRAPGRSRRGERARVRQQRLPRDLRRGGPTLRLPGREAADAARHGAGRPRALGLGARPALDRSGWARAPIRRGDPGLEQPLPVGARRRLRIPSHASTTACSASRSPARRRAAERAGAARSGRCGNGAPRRSRSTRTIRFPPASTARRRGSIRRCGSASGQGSCGCGSRQLIPAPRRQPSFPTASSTACACSRE